MFGFETHCHSSEHSTCSHVSIEEIIVTAVERDLFGIIITDHHYQWPQAELDDIKKRVGANDLVVLSAYELTTADPISGKHAGDILIFGSPDDAVMPIWTPWDEACRRVRELNALSISAHPFREGMGAGDLIFRMDIDGMEIFNINHSQPLVNRAKAAVKKLGCIGTAGSDVHNASEIGLYQTVLDEPVFTIEEFINQLHARRFALMTNHPTIR